MFCFVLFFNERLIINWHNGKGAAEKTQSSSLNVPSEHHSLLQSPLTPFGTLLSDASLGGDHCLRAQARWGWDSCPYLLLFLQGIIALEWKVKVVWAHLSCSHSTGQGGFPSSYDWFITKEDLLLGNGIYTRIFSAPTETRDLVIKLRSKGGGLNKVPWESSILVLRQAESIFLRSSRINLKYDLTISIFNNQVLKEKQG